MKYRATVAVDFCFISTCLDLLANNMSKTVFWILKWQQIWFTTSIQYSTNFYTKFFFVQCYYKKNSLNFHRNTAELIRRF